MTTIVKLERFALGFAARLARHPMDGHVYPAAYQAENERLVTPQELALLSR